MLPSSYTFGTSSRRSRANTIQRKAQNNAANPDGKMTGTSGSGARRVHKSMGNRRTMKPSNRANGTTAMGVPMGHSGYGPKQ